MSRLETFGKPMQRSGDFLAMVPGLRDHLPASLQPQKFEHCQEIFQKFQNRLGIITNFAYEQDEDSAQKHADRVVDSLVAGDVIDEETVVEYRPLLAQRTISAEPAASVMPTATLLCETTHDRHGIQAIAPDRPILATRDSTSPVDSDEMCGALGYELELLDRQAATGTKDDPYKNAAMMLVARLTDAENHFGDWMVLDGQPLKQGLPMVLSKVGADPQEYVFSPPAVPVRMMV